MSEQIVCQLAHVGDLVRIVMVYEWCAAGEILIWAVAEALSCGQADDRSFATETAHDYAVWVGILERADAVARYASRKENLEGGRNQLGTYVPPLTDIQ